MPRVLCVVDNPEKWPLHLPEVSVVAARAYLGLPIILKQPDSSFSQGVIKVETDDQYLRVVHELLDQSDLLIERPLRP